MQAKLRYLALLTALLTATVLICLINRIHNFHSLPQFTEHHGIRTKRSSLPNLPSAFQAKVMESFYGNLRESQKNAENEKTSDETLQCTMQTCFNFTRCAPKPNADQTFKVYVYEDTPGVRISQKYEEILESIRKSRFFTSNADEACLFVLSIDTLDRDKLSSEFVHEIQEKLGGLKHWNNGINHVIFNLYSGTWPDYSAQDLGFDFGKAILAQASLPLQHYRPGFDVSFPLFHKELPLRGGEPGLLASNSVPPVRQYTLSFKGKRYLHGIGSESRNALHHIHNGQDIILLTTCRHANTPKHLYDNRCVKDDQEYEKYAIYTHILIVIMLNSCHLFILHPLSMSIIVI